MEDVQRHLQELHSAGSGFNLSGWRCPCLEPSTGGTVKLPSALTAVPSAQHLLHDSIFGKRLSICINRGQIEHFALYYHFFYPGLSKCIYEVDGKN